MSIWIHGDSEDKFYDEFIEYISGKGECVVIIEQELALFKIERFWIEHGYHLQNINCTIGIF